MTHGKILRIILASDATVVWSGDGWKHVRTIDATHEIDLNIWFTDFKTSDLPVNAAIAFTFFWNRDQRWEGQNWQVSLV